MTSTKLMNPITPELQNSRKWGGWGVDGKMRGKKLNGRLLQGRTWDAVPEFSGV
jgi:protein gp37